jgi:hypothetical protein
MEISSMSVSEPGKIITPWAESGLKNTIPPAANPATGRAGFDQGFSAINMTAKEAGGIPPFGQDFNGIFYEVTKILRYMQAGGQPTFSPAMAAAINGYPSGAMVLGNDGLTLWQSQIDSNMQDPNTDSSTWSKVNIGFRMFDTIQDLRLSSPKYNGEVVYVRASIPTPIGVYGYFGGGCFAAYDNIQANIDDGGVFVNSPHVTLDWQRINFTEYDMRFWGMITDLASFDNAPAITLATNFAKARRVLLHAPAGNIYTSEMVPVYDNMGITGHGSAEQTVFYKTTNNAFPYKANGNTAFTVDALVGFVPKKSIAGGSMVDGETHTARPHLSKCMFRRAGLTEANYGSTRPAVGMFLGSLAGGLISDVTVEGGYNAFQGWTCYLLTIERLFGNSFPGKGFTGFTVQAYTAAPVGHKTSGTSLDMRLVNVRGYQIGFEMIGQQYTSMTCCTVEECEPMAGETNAIAFKFINPYAITMDACATEGVKGTQISVINSHPVSYKSSLVVQNFIAIDQRNPKNAGTKFIEIDNGAVGTLNVTFIGGDLTRDVRLSNLAGATVSGVGAKAISIGAGGLDMAGINSGIYTNLA